MVYFQITLGTINSIDDAVEWLSYTYLFVRMKRNPQEYGINYDDVEVISFSMKISFLSNNNK